MIETRINPEILKRFALTIDRDRLAHAYLFVGPSGVGKVETAIELAKAVNCANPVDHMPCHQCESCQKIEAGNHPDIWRLNIEEGEKIKIDDVRDIIGRATLRPYEAKKKVFIVDRIERMTIQAGNALLKTLEEPTKDNMIILTTAVVEANLDTIRSRCQSVYFPAMSTKDLAQQLQSEHSLQPAEALCIARFAEGSLGEAQQLMGNKFITKKNKVLDQFVLSRDVDAYVKKIAGDPQEVAQALHIMSSFFVDILHCQGGQEAMYWTHQDRVGDVRQLANKYSHQDVVDILDEITKTVAMAKQNFNVKIGLSLIKELM